MRLRTPQRSLRPSEGSSSLYLARANSAGRRSGLLIEMMTHLQANSFDHREPRGVNKLVRAPIPLRRRQVMK